MNDVEKRLLTIERENAALRAELAALRSLLGNKSPAPLPPSPVKITSPPLAKIVLPTPDEYHRLLAIVLDRYPVLRPRDPQGFEAEFCLGFQFLAHTGRREKIDRNHDLLFWIDTAAAWGREHKIAPGVPGIGAAAFVAAAIAGGDIQFTSLDEFPYVYFGLVPFGGDIPAKDFWRRSLAGALVEPSPALHPTPLPAPSKITRGAA
jgi:hypothetical protein